MIIPVFVDLYYGSPDWKVFALCSLFTLFFGGMLSISNHTTHPSHMSVRQAFLMTATSWLMICIFGSIPLWFSELGLSFTDALFESVSGITTTGSTIIVGLDDSPPGLLIWRALLQWLGGIGIIVMAISVLPLLKVGGMQLFRTESSENEKVLPRAKEFAMMICIIYIGLTIVCLLAYYATGMALFESFAHSMTTVATGGFSTRDASFGAYEGTYADMVATFFILLSALPFVLYLKFLKGDRKALFRDTQVRAFLGFVFFISLFASFNLAAFLDIPVAEAARLAVFNITSIISGTGYTNTNYGEWSSILVVIFFTIMFIGGCAGSTSCGIKIFRFQILFMTLRHQIQKLTHPNAVYIKRYNNSVVSDDVPISVIGFVCLFFMSFAAIAFLLLLTGTDIITALSGAATSISNVGPGLGDIIGPVGNFEPLSDPAKWVLSAGMLLGRLELYTLYILFLPRFWRA